MISLKTIPMRSHQRISMNLKKLSWHYAVVGILGTGLFMAFQNFSFTDAVLSINSDTYNRLLRAETFNVFQEGPVTGPTGTVLGKYQIGLVSRGGIALALRRKVILLQKPVDKYISLSAPSFAINGSDSVGFSSALYDWNKLDDLNYQSQSALATTQPLYVNANGSAYVPNMNGLLYFNDRLLQQISYFLSELPNYRSIFANQKLPILGSFLSNIENGFAKCVHPATEIFVNGVWINCEGASINGLSTLSLRLAGIVQSYGLYRNQLNEFGFPEEEILRILPPPDLSKASPLRGFRNSAGSFDGVRVDNYDPYSQSTSSIRKLGKLPRGFYSELNPTIPLSGTVGVLEVQVSGQKNLLIATIDGKLYQTYYINPSVSKELAPAVLVASNIKPISLSSVSVQGFFDNDYTNSPAARFITSSGQVMLLLLKNLRSPVNPGFFVDDKIEAPIVSVVMASNKYNMSVCGLNRDMIFYCSGYRYISWTDVVGAYNGIRFPSVVQSMQSFVGSVALASGICSRRLIGCNGSLFSYSKFGNLGWSSFNSAQYGMVNASKQDISMAIASTGTAVMSPPNDSIYLSETTTSSTTTTGGTTTGGTTTGGTTTGGTTTGGTTTGGTTTGGTTTGGTTTGGTTTGGTTTGGTATGGTTTGGTTTGGSSTTSGGGGGGYFDTNVQLQ